MNLYSLSANSPVIYLENGYLMSNELVMEPMQTFASSNRMIFKTATDKVGKQLEYIILLMYDLWERGR